MTFKPYSASLSTLIASGGLATLVVAGIGAYTNLATRVEERTTPNDVRQLIDDKTSARYDEILRRLDRLDRQIDRLSLLTPAPKQR